MQQLTIFTQPLRSGRIWHKVNDFKRSLTGLNSEFSISWTSCLTKAEELSLSYYLSIARGRIIGFIPFPRVLVLCEMQSAWSRIWTCVALSISHDDHNYTTGTSVYVTANESFFLISKLRFGSDLPLFLARPIRNYFTLKPSSTK